MKVIPNVFPDCADIDPRNPANWFEPSFRYDIIAQGACGQTMIDRLEDKATAKAFAFNLNSFVGIEVFIREIDLETGDDTCVLSAEWDADIQRYVEE